MYKYKFFIICINVFIASFKICDRIYIIMIVKLSLINNNLIVKTTDLIIKLNLCTEKEIIYNGFKSKKKVRNG